MSTLCAPEAPVSPSLAVLETVYLGASAAAAELEDALLTPPLLNQRRYETSARMYDRPDMWSMVTAFQALGGSVVFAPAAEVIEAGTPFCVHVRPADLCVPVCHEAQNRAQIMYLVLHGLKRSHMPARVALPHGAESGFDPYQAYHNLDAGNVYGYIHGRILPLEHPLSAGDYMGRNFQRVFGLPKARRVGQDHCELAGLELNPDETMEPSAELYRTLAEHRTAQRAAMDALLFAPERLKAECGPGGRVLVFCFARAAGHFLFRLLEVATKMGADEPAVMAGVHVIALPFPDTISRAGSPGEVDAHYRATGDKVDRDFLSCVRHERVYAFFASLLHLVM